GGTGHPGSDPCAPGGEGSAVGRTPYLLRSSRKQWQHRVDDRAASAEGAVGGDVAVCDYERGFSIDLARAGPRIDVSEGLQALQAGDNRAFVDPPTLSVPRVSVRPARASQGPEYG